MQQIQARSQKPKEPEAKSQKPNGHANWLQTAANSMQIRDFGSKMQQIQVRSQKPKEPEAKSQMGMQIGSKLLQIAGKSEILAPKCSKYKPEARNRRSQKPNGHANWLQTAANSTQIRDVGSKMQQIQARSQKPKEPEAAKSQKPEAKQKKMLPQKNP